MLHMNKTISLCRLATMLVDCQSKDELQNDCAMNEVFPLVLYLGIGGGVGFALALAVYRTRWREACLREESLRRMLEEEQGQQDALQLRFEQTFAALAADALKSNNESFLELARTSLERFQSNAQGELKLRQQAIEQMVRPLRDSLQLFDDKVKSLEVARVDAYSGLREQIQQMTEVQRRLQQETASLAKALRTPHVRGRWGEMQLRRTVELAGMLQYVDFNEQPTLADEALRQRPDMVIRLPNDRCVVVDAKAPLSAYLDALETEDEGQQKELLQTHARQVRTHLQQLGSKQYWKQLKQSPEFVVLFLPGESFFSAALERDPALIEAGVGDKVILATPTTLIALLKAIAFGWRQEQMADEAEAVSKLGRDLYERIAVWSGHLNGVGKGLERAVDHYNKAVGSLERMVLPQARKFRSLPVSTQTDIPQLDPLTGYPREVAVDEGTLETKPAADSEKGIAT